MKRLAVIVGVTQYEKAEMADLKYSSNDAVRLASVLIEHADFSAADIKLLCDGDAPESPLEIQAPSYSDVLAEIERMAREASPGDAIFFYFAGHGNELSNAPYLLTNDTRLAVIKDTAISVARVNELLAESAASMKVKIFDACRAGAGQRALQLRGMADGFSRAILESAKGSVTFSACSSGEFAHEHPDLEQGIFTYHLCEGIVGAATNAGGVVTIDSLADYVRTAVGVEAKSRGHKQAPQYSCDIAGTFELSRPTLVTSTPDSAGPTEGRLLRTFVDEHLAQAPDYLRHGSVTQAEDVQPIIEQLFNGVTDGLHELDDSALTVEDLGTCQLIAGYDDWMPAFERIREQGLEADLFRGQTPCMRRRLTSSVSIIPSCNLEVALICFNLCHWVWLSMAPHLPTDTRVIQLDPEWVFDYRTLLPADARKKDKIQKAVDFILQRITTTLAAWSRQCKEQIENRIDLLREEDGLL